MCSLPDKNGLHVPSGLQVKRNDQNLYQLQGLWYYKGSPFSGHIIQETANHTIVYKASIEEGMANGRSLSFYADGQPMLEQAFLQGRLHGASKQYWRNGQCKYVLFYKNGQFEGTQKAFFESGQVREEANYLAGKPEGLQRSWDEKGQLISNYTIRNNKLYGIIRAESCLPEAAH